MDERILQNKGGISITAWSRKSLPAETAITTRGHNLSGLAAFIWNPSILFRIKYMNQVLRKCADVICWMKCFMYNLHSSSGTPEGFETFVLAQLLYLCISICLLMPMQKQGFAPVWRIYKTSLLMLHNISFLRSVRILFWIIILNSAPRWVKAGHLAAP